MSRCDVEAPEQDGRLVPPAGTFEHVDMWHEKMKESPESQKLFWACVRGEHAGAMDALVAKANPNCCNRDGLNGLMVAAAGGHTECVRLLVTAGARVNSLPSKHGLTAMGLAAARGAVDILQLLSGWGADANTGHMMGRTALMHSAASGQLTATQFLVEKRAVADAHDPNGVTPLMLAVEREQLDVANFLLLRAENAGGVARCDRRCRSALTRAIENLIRDEQTANLFEVSPLSRDPQDWKSFARQAVEKGADINLVDTYGESLLIKALRAKRLDLVKHLCELKANVNLPCPVVHGGGCLLMAMDLQAVDATKTLLTFNADVNKANRDGQTALMVAVEHGNAPMCHYLIDQAADVFVVDKTGQSILMKAAEHGLPDVYSRVLRACPDVCKPVERVHTVMTDRDIVA